MQSVLNVRMNSVLKERGDKVLAENGISVSNAVRSLWEELVKTREIPPFMKASSEAEARKQKRRDALNKLSSLCKEEESAIDFSQLDDETLRNLQYEEKWREYEALK